jgi:hypothetical protein
MDSSLLLSQSLFPEYSPLAVQDMHGDETLTVRLHSTGSEVTSTACVRTSTRIHRRYYRMLTDLLSSGRRVRLMLQVRRFFCTNPPCPRKTYAERFPQLARPHDGIRFASSTPWLRFRRGGGSSLGPAVRLPASPDCLPRLMQQREAPPQSRSTHFGLDGWAYKRKLHYGALICDPELFSDNGCGSPPY